MKPSINEKVAQKGHLEQNRMLNKHKVFETELVEFNGATGLLVIAKNQDSLGVVTAFQLDINEGKIQHVFAHRNPDKLKCLDLHF